MRLLQKINQIMIMIFLMVSSSYALTTDHKQNKLISYAYLGEFSQEQAALALKRIPPLTSLEAKFALNLYKIDYQTIAPNGEATIASGLVALPIAPQKQVAIVSYQHGTRVARDDVPSTNKENNYIYPAVFASTGGYMLVMPDYLGHGDNTLPIHPYVQAQTLASSSVDMLIAAKEMAQALHYPISNQLFLAGYSEGGFSTTVMYEELLKHHQELAVTAAAPGSAPFDWQETMRFTLLQPGPRSTAYLAYFFYSMQVYHHYWNNLGDVFRKPYDTLVPTLYDGKHQMQEILQALPHDPRLILNESFLQSVIDGTEAHTDELKRNFNHYDFTATSPLLLIGTKGDHDVPYHGAEIAYQALKARSDKVYLKHVSDVLDHIQAFPLVTKEQLKFFKQYER